MLPVRTVGIPKATTLPDKTLYEFPIFGAVSLADNSEWEPIAIKGIGIPVKLLKPRVGHISAQAEGRITSQALDVRYTTFTFESALCPVAETLTPNALLPSLNGIIHLLRTVTRQYWLGLTMANEGAVFQAVRARIESGTATFEGVGGFTMPFDITPIDWKAWHFLGELLQREMFPSSAEVLLCDALLEARRGDLLRSLMLLGVACEVEVVKLIDQLATRKGLSNNKKKSLSREHFKAKFLHRTVELGASDPRSSTIPQFPPNWADMICMLYMMRNDIAHSGICMVNERGKAVPAEMRHLTDSIHATDALLCWANAERRRLGMPAFVTATMSPSGYPIKAITL